jgi:DnaK suppressor protein
MRKQEMARYRKDLSSQLTALLVHGGETVHEMVAREEGLVPDPNDRATAESDRIQALRMRDRDRKLIPKIQAALHRIEQGTFGTCEGCGGRIAAARLKARPMTTLCIACKREAELQER